jgi:polyphenol oxidase
MTMTLMKAVLKLFMSVIKVSPLSSPFLYTARLGHIATVRVTHNCGNIDEVYAGNVALHVHDDTHAVLQRRATLETTLNQPIQWLQQVHSTVVYTALDTVLHPAPIADAAITQSAHIALAVMTADCLPVVLTAQNAQGQRAIAIAHAGWRGLLHGIVENTCQALHHKVPNALLHAHLAPCIGVAQFEIGSEVKTAFINKNSAFAKNFTDKAPDKFLGDLTALARQTLMFEGIASNNISGGGFCTVSDPRLASYRRRAVTGRFATLVSF